MTIAFQYFIVAVQEKNITSLEVLLGAHYNIAGLVQVGVAGGLGVLREPGTPDARALLRVAYAPMAVPSRRPADHDGDGVPDKTDACPTEPGVATSNPRTNGCPPPDRDHDGVLDEQDLCPDQAKGDRPDPARIGCPILDRDRDGVLDAQDLCPELAQGEHPDAKRLGCPDKDSDGDEIFDSQDQCPTQPKTAHPDPARLGCPDQDTDNDGVYDAQDQCVKVPASVHPDPAKPGCPLPDRDGDSIIDKVDACPDKPGAPDPNPKKNGCPGLVVIKRGQIVILRAVFFNNDQDVILKKSFPVLQAVANALVTQPEITKLAVEGHTDDRGDAAHNVDLSDRRASSVQRWLVEHGIEAARLSAKGYGPQHPIADNGTLYGRAKNRRVEFRILEPASLAVPDPSRGAPAAGKASEDVEPPPAGAENVASPAPAAAAATDAAPEPKGKKARGKKGRVKAGKAAADGNADAAAGGKKAGKKKRTKKPKA